MLGLLTFTIFFDDNIFGGYIFQKEFNFFFKNGPGNEQSIFRHSIERDTKPGPKKPALNDLGKGASNVSEPT